MPRDRDNSSELEQLREQLVQLQALVQGTGHAYHIPDPIKQLSEYTGNKKELNAWLQEVDELFEEFKIKGENGAPDSINAHYLRAIKNKLKGEARTVVCANGNPDTLQELKRILRDNFGDQRDFVTNLNQLFHIRKGDKSNSKYFNEIKELNTKLKSNLQLHPLSTTELLEILTVTKFLDGISEPLASIIRNSKPKSLDDAYQSVVINQNAETRKPIQKQTYSNKFTPYKSQNAQTSGSRPPQASASQPNTFHKYKKPFHAKPRAETNNTEENEVLNEAEQREEVEEDVVSDVSDSDVECDELNFQKVRKRGPPI